MTDTLHRHTFCCNHNTGLVKSVRIMYLVHCGRGSAQSVAVCYMDVSTVVAGLITPLSPLPISKVPDIHTVYIFQFSFLTSTFLLGPSTWPWPLGS